MKNCKVVQDLIPLYIEDLTSGESHSFIEDHLQDCEDCRTFLNQAREDFTPIPSNTPDEKQLNQIVETLANYQHKIKVFGVMVAMLFSSIIVGAQVEFLYTLPFIAFVPFICRLFYHRSLPIILSSIPFALVGGLLNEQSFAIFFMFVSLVFTLLGVGAAALWQVSRTKNNILKTLSISIAAVVLILNTLFFVSLFGNPYGYIKALFDTKKYVNQTYESDTLHFKGITYNFKDKMHSGRYEYVLNGSRQEAFLTVYPDGTVDDSYAYMLEQLFAEERAANLHAAIRHAVHFRPLTVQATPLEPLNVTRYDLNQTFHHLSYDPERREQARINREEQSGKLQYVIGFGTYYDEYDSLTKEEFTAFIDQIQETLKQQGIPYHAIELHAGSTDGETQQATFKWDE